MSLILLGVLLSVVAAWESGDVAAELVTVGDSLIPGLSAELVGVVGLASIVSLASDAVVIVVVADDMALDAGQLPDEVVLVDKLDQVLSENGRLVPGSSLDCRFGVECDWARGLDPTALFRAVSPLASLSGDGSFH